MNPVTPPPKNNDPFLNELTARVPSKTLSDHLQGFLSIHFDAAAEIPPIYHGELVNLFLEVVKKPSVRIKHARQTAKKIARLTERSVSHAVALDIIGELMGYKNWPDAIAHVKDAEYDAKGKILDRCVIPSNLTSEQRKWLDIE